MTAPPAGALDIVERLRRCATTMINDDQSEPETRLRQRMVERVEAINDAADALLAALRLREGCEGLMARIEREADAHTYFADNADLRMTTGDHAKRATKLTAIRDDLARVLEESATGGDAGSA